MTEVDDNSEKGGPPEPAQTELKANDQVPQPASPLVKAEAVINDSGSNVGAGGFVGPSSALSVSHRSNQSKQPPSKLIKKLPKVQSPIKLKQTMSLA